jgi:hypothetical protein
MKTKFNKVKSRTLSLFLLGDASNYSIYLTVEKCLVTEYKGDFRDSELRKTYSK